ncbi:MAG: alpha/beta hydrolase [Phenylobacterium sp.]
MLAGLLAATAAAADAAPKLMDWPDLLGRPAPKATASIPYGADPLQVAEVWRPDGKGPFPTVLMIHGGCWRSGVADLHVMDYAAEDLRRRGFAVWNIEYRGVDRPGGGYPGTFQDVNAAADALMAHARDYQLRTDHIVVLGHSAGGHLALWLAGRPKLPAGSPLNDKTALPISWVVSLGGLPDLATASEGCGQKTVDLLLAGSSGADKLSDTSPASQLPSVAPRILIHGALDETAPPAQGKAYVEKARAAGDIRAWTYAIPGEGHVEEIAPGSKTWAAVAAGVESVFRSRDHSWPVVMKTPTPPRSGS